MKHITFRKWLLPLCMAATCLSASAVDLKTRFATFRVDKKGYIVKMTNLQTGKDYVPKGHPSPIIQLYDGKDYLAPIKLAANGNRWLLTFSNGSVATVSYADEGTYIRMQLEALTKRDHIQAICWGPYATTLSKYIGETVGVVRDGEFAIGVQPLQISTSEGRPHLGDDASGGYYVRPLPGQTVPEEYQDKIGQQVADINVNEKGDMPEYIRLIRGNAAVERDYGSDIQFFSRDWRTARTVDLYGRRQHIVSLDSDFIGSSIALFAVPDGRAVETIGEIEVTEGLPHPMKDGQWIKQRKLPNPAYMLYEGASPYQALDYADSCGFHLVHIGDIFKSWGHFDLHTRRFPQGAAQIKAFTDKARQRGIEIGVHTLTMFTSTHDPYVTPIASDSLCISGSAKLGKDISATDKEIVIDSPEFFTYFGETHSAKIGGEIVSYRSISKDAPYRLLDCTRGQFGTKATYHRAGDRIDKLVNNCYSGFFPDIHLQQVYGKRLAEVCNETGIGLMDFDGYYGGSPTGHGCLGASMFLKQWYDGLADKGVISCGSSTFHYWWHIYTFMNWGEPWYSNLRQSQVNYRLENQRYFERNLMPGMLGWFKLEQTYRPEDIEWIQARSAAFNAGYLLRVDESIEQNGFKSRLFEAIREWQKVRNDGFLTEAQREELKNPRNEYHLERNDNNSWTLYRVALKGGNRHKYHFVQTGEPLLSRCTFENPYETQPIQFYATIEAGEQADATLSHLQIQVEGAATIEVPMAMKAGNKLYCDGKTVYVCNDTWQPLASYPIPDTALWSNGTNNVTLSCEFSSEKAPAINVEFKAIGNAEQIGR